MASLRELGDQIALILSIYDGKDFMTNVEEGLRLVVSLDSRETLETEEIDAGSVTDAPEFNTELVWTMERQTFQALRSRKVPLKMQAMTSKNQCLGTFMFDLREAVILPSLQHNQADESYIGHSSWRKLICNDIQGGRTAPSINAALVLGQVSH